VAQSFEVSIIIPAWNEEFRLPRTLDEVIKYLQQQPLSAEILVVTDGSKDRTAEVAQSYADSFQSLRVLAFPFNKGKGWGVKTGMLEAHGQFRLFMDADYAVPVEFLTPFLNEIRKGYDCVIASRALENTKIEQSQSFPRKELAQLFGLMQRTILNIPFKDTQCGFKLFTASCAEKLFSRLTLDCAYFDAELLYLAHHMNMKVAELPVTWTHDPETRLPIGARRSVDLFKKMLLIPKTHAESLKALKEKRPGEPS